MFLDNIIQKCPLWNLEQQNTMALIENIVCKIVRISCYACKEKKLYTFINTIKYTFFKYICILNLTSIVQSTNIIIHFVRFPKLLYNYFCALHYAKHQKAHLLFQVKTLFFSCKQIMQYIDQTVRLQLLASFGTFDSFLTGQGRN